jgi:hypothetical protein
MLLDHQADQPAQWKAIESPAPAGREGVRFYIAPVLFPKK